MVIKISDYISVLTIVRIINMKKVRVKKHCAICNTKFELIPSQSHYKHCSLKCANISRTGPNSSRWKGGRKVASAKYRYKKRDGGKLTSKTLREIFTSSSGRCVYCDIKMTYNDWPSLTYATIDHIIPLDKNGTNDKDNLCVACYGCNVSKKNKLLSEWKKE